ncbi:MAG: metal ABC transporter permease [Tepidisphaerales bacterium]
MLALALPIPSLLALLAMAVACALLSVIVVLRGWAFIGEGIAHAGFGGAGTAWMLSLLLPSVALFHTPAGIYLTSVAFCIVIALAIGTFTRRGLVHADAVIGIFLVLSLAWGLLAQSIYMYRSHGMAPPDFPSYFLGSDLSLLPAGFLFASAVACVAVIVVVALLAKEIVYYAFDPMLAETSGVRVGLIHYLLIVLITVAIVIGMRILGSLLVTALLILPGAAALLVSRDLRTVLGISIATSLAGTLAGAAVHVRWRFIPDGPAIVLALVLVFVGCYAARTLRQ